VNKGERDRKKEIKAQECFNVRFIVNKKYTRVFFVKILPKYCC